jgi:pimeloyl-ACP methyl ester carboxylesterase
VTQSGVERIQSSGGGGARIQVGEREIAYDDPCVDDAAGRVVLLCVHGSSFGRGTWQPCLPLLAATGRYRPIALDQPGHGGSSGPVCHSVEELGTNVAAFVDALALPRPLVYLGHSLGGAVGQWYQQRFPDAVSALGLISTSPGFTVSAETLARWKADGLHYPVERLDGIVSPDADAGSRSRVMDARANTTIDAIAGWHNPAWLDIDVPVLVVTADADTPAIQDYARRWADGLPRATFASIPRAGHMMPIEQPELTTRAILDWLDALAGPEH